MSFNAQTGSIEWPDKLVWSGSLEVQLILADIPLIALGVLGLASAMLLMVTRRLSREALILTVSMLFAFAAGFLNLFSLLLGEDDKAVLQGMGKQSLSILSEICDGWLTSTQLLFLFCRMLQIMREDREDCDSLAIGYYAREKDVFGVTVKCKILEIVSGRLVKYGLYIHVVIVTALDIAWRHLLLDDRKPAFKSIHLASNALQFTFLFSVLAIVAYELLRSKRKGRFAYQWLPLITGIIIDLSLKITGFAILAFTVTPLARLFTAAVIYIWLLDLLVHDFRRGMPPSSTNSPADTPGEEDASSRNQSPSLKQLRLMVSSPFLVDSPIRSQASIPSTLPRPRLSNLAKYPEYRRTLSVGPVIRRSSRLPSWLGQRRRKSSDSETNILRIDVEQQAGPRRLSSASLASIATSWREEGDHALSNTASSSHHAPSCSVDSSGHARSTREPRSKRSASVTSTTGTYNEVGIRLDSPIEVAMGFTSPSTSLPSNAKMPFMASTAFLPTMTEVVEDEVEDRSKLAPLASDTTAYHSNNHSTPSQNPSIFSRGSDMSLSYFPRPPSPSVASQYDEGRRKGNTRSVMGVTFDLQPPRMPAVQVHQHDSWQSGDTFTGSAGGLVPPAHNRGFNVTSFIGNSAGPDTTAKMEESTGGAKILRASSLTRHSAKLLRRSNPAREHQQIDSLAPPKRVDSLKDAAANASSTMARPDIARHASSNAAVVKDIIDGY